MAEAFELGDEALGGACGVAAGEVVAAEVVVELAGLEHLPAGGEDRVGDGDAGAAGAAADAESRLLGLQVGVLGARGRLGRFDQRAA